MYNSLPRNIGHEIPSSVAARGRGHSVRGQAMTRGGGVVVVDMPSLRGGCICRCGGRGDQLWIDVLRATLKHGLAPVSWTDYLYLSSVGGTLSSAGISGQAFVHGPQINNVLELDVVTGKGEFELFFGVLGGLGQFGIITRARIVLHKAPTRKNKAILYSIELVKYYHNQTAQTIDHEFEKLLKELNFIPGFIFTKDASFFDFLNRVGDLDTNVPKGKLTDSHPWRHLFVPKWDNRISAVIPDEEVFYMLGLLHSTGHDKYHIYDKFNDRILRLCKKAGVNVKQYLPQYKSKQDWIKHYGSKWKIIRQTKATFDPKMILSPGQRIFN
ncbi:hypothetical protein ABFX02_10G093000 [Erythranthe guttata]